MTADCDCDQQVMAHFVERHIDVIVSDKPLFIDSDYEDLAMRCPHGTVWYAEPTRAQVVRWWRDGVA